jgi:DNA-binding CsgD family transcriptional regulator
MPLRPTEQETQPPGASDEGAAVAYADATIARLFAWAAREGVDLNEAAIDAVIDPPIPEILPRLLRRSGTLLAALTDTVDAALVAQLEGFAAASPPPQASDAERMVWVETVRQAMRARMTAAGEDPDDLAALRAGRPLRAGSLSEQSAGVLMPVILILVLTDLYVASLGGRQEFRRHGSETLAGMLLAAEQGGLLFPTPLQAPAPFDDLVQVLAVAHARSTISLSGKSGRRLRTALSARHGDDLESVLATLAEELPGAVAIARADVGAAAASPGTLSDVRVLMDTMRTLAAKEVERAQAVDLDRDARPRTGPIAETDGSQWGAPTEATALQQLEVEARLRRVSLLTRRQREVLQLIADGRTQADVAATLGVSVNSVRVHLHNARRKVNPDPDEEPS